MQQTLKLTKKEITDLIVNDKNFKSLITLYKSQHTKCFAWDVKSEYKNGLTTEMFGIITNGKLTTLIVPVFSTENTITWDIRYAKSIREALPAEFQEMEDHQIAAVTKCMLYKCYPDDSGVQLMQLVTLNDWLEYGAKSKFNSFSVYFFNDKLPNQYAISKGAVKSEIFVSNLSLLKKKDIKDICTEYALNYHKRFADTTQRSEMTKVKNIASGLYAQIQVYLQLKADGHNVSMEWRDKDDLGIDITYHTDKMDINIDVKSTRDEYLKITKNRKETDFYAVVRYEKGIPVFLGMLDKWNFWSSKVLNTDAPEQTGDTYRRKLTKAYSKNFVDITEMEAIKNNYKKLKLKRGERLFNAE